MKLTLFNSLTRTKEIFLPISDESVDMYVCGPTVYDRPHIGNARSVVCYDILYRVLVNIYGFEKVQYVRNITDIDDKIINRAKEDNISIKDLTLKTTKLFHSDMEYLSCLKPNKEPKATEHVKDIINIIKKLIERDIAYISSGHVYFDVSKSKNYSRLSGQSIDELLDSVRIEQSEGKRNSADFVLWKPSNDNEDDFNNFDSPFGKGRPGWHIECSAMSHKFFGENFDIHGGGIDLIFPHHTNEIAQSCSAFPGSNYAKTWVHNGFLTINKEKMSKSLGNFLTVKDLIDKNMKGEVIRLFLISSHYRKPLDYNEKAIKDSSIILDYWYRAIEPLTEKLSDIDNLPSEFLDALHDDLNTHQAITIINEYAKQIYVAQTEEKKLEYANKLYACAQFLGFLLSDPKKWFRSGVDEKAINLLIKERQKAKDEKNWKQADIIRDKLHNMGVSLEDSKNGTTIWKKD